jgi:NADH:ubiquinone oxidoreductase subunit D
MITFYIIYCQILKYQERKHLYYSNMFNSDFKTFDEHIKLTNVATSLEEMMEHLSSSVQILKQCINKFNKLRIENKDKKYIQLYLKDYMEIITIMQESAEETHNFIGKKWKLPYADTSDTGASDADASE